MRVRIVQTRKAATLIAINGSMLPAAMALAISASCATPCLAQKADQSKMLEQVVVTGTTITSDEEVTNQVERALRSDPYVLDEHVTVTTKNGVVVLRGIALDYWDVQMMKRLARRMPGVRKVVDDIDVRQGGE